MLKASEIDIGLGALKAGALIILALVLKSFFHSMKIYLYSVYISSYCA